MNVRFLLFFFLFQNLVFSQLEDAWVFFNNKPNYEYFIENPLLILSHICQDGQTAPMLF